MKDKWKDIASAPKDGRMVLLFGYHPLRGYGEIVIGAWDALFKGFGDGMTSMVIHLLLRIG